ncbi:mercury resistance system transport protein MerF [uncultured Sneathiella sp.]|uniref:mercury resistance system transport protein MerF n=1 Tax=uncultured Sneathiella sp. TaxID=879315 RepID=UPI002597A91F|nr:mercury resistance system transport protein MerF [uncultured Sneathiella sp.]
MNEKKSLRLGITGTVIGAVCCFTPLLVVVFGFAGISAWLGWIDYALFPVMFASMGVVAYALYLRSGKVGPNPKRYLIFAVVGLLALLFWLEFRFAIRISIAAVVAVAAYAFYLYRRKPAAEPSTNTPSEMEHKT